MKNACFIDRDGVLIRELDYLSDPDKVEILPGVVEALRQLRVNGFLAIVATNQSGVARGYFGEDAVRAVHERIDAELARDGVGIDAWYHCPHHVKGIVAPHDVECGCRKPQPGMLLQAADDLDVDLSGSFLVGDKISDLRAGVNAGCQAVFLSKTGYGTEQNLDELPEGAEVVDDLRSAVKRFFGTSGNNASP